LYRIALLFLVSALAFSPAVAFGNLITKPEQLAGEGVNFTWREVQSKSLSILLQYRNQDGEWQSVNLGSGFLISPDGLFVTAYHVMKYCLSGREGSPGFAVTVECSHDQQPVRYRARNGEREYDIQLLSFLREADATSGKGALTPDEIIKRRDFVIGKLKADKTRSFRHWDLTEFDESRIDLNNPAADFHLTPLMPPKRVFIMGFPKNDQLVISAGFLNLTEKNGRGYFAADYEVYPAEYLHAHGLAPETQWGMQVENHMSGGPVMDSSGRVIGVVVNGNHNTAGVLSIENVLSTFFSRTRLRESAPDVILNPTAKPLYLKGASSAE
jgi:hypothetical protein